VCGKCNIFTSTVSSIFKTDVATTSLNFETTVVTPQSTTVTDYEETESTATPDFSIFSDSISTSTLDATTSFIFQYTKSNTYESTEKLRSTTEIIKTTTGCSITDCENNGYFNSALCECQCKYKTFKELI
jgi:hypothetical protein